MRRLRERWICFWFEPSEPMNLGFCRSFFFASILVLYLVLPPNTSGWVGFSNIFWMPIPLFNHFHLPVLSGELLRILEVVWLVTLGLSSIGLFTHLSTAVSLILGVYLLWLPHNFGKLHHMDAVVVLVLTIMAFSKCGDGWSLDRLLWKATRRTGASMKRPGPSGEYTWPIRAVWMVMALIFFAAGISKLRHSGLEWIFSDNVALMLAKANYRAYSGIAPLTSWGLYVAKYGWLCRLLAGATVVCEVGYPLALISRRVRWIIVPGMLLNLIGITFVLVPAFSELIFCHVFWVRWDHVGRRLRRG